MLSLHVRQPVREYTHWPARPPGFGSSDSGGHNLANTRLGFPVATSEAIRGAYGPPYAKKRRSAAKSDTASKTNSLRPA